MRQTQDVHDRLRHEHDRSWARSFGTRQSTISDRSAEIYGSLGRRRFQILSLFFAIFAVAAIITFSSSSDPDQLFAQNPSMFKASVEGVVTEHSLSNEYISFFVVPVTILNETPNSSIRTEAAGLGGFTPTWQNSQLNIT